jgi:hypothetical protein
MASNAKIASALTTVASSLGGAVTLAILTAVLKPSVPILTVIASVIGLGLGFYANKRDQMNQHPS